MKTILTSDVKQIDCMAASLAGTGMVGVVHGGHGSGKSEAAKWAKKHLEESGDYGRILLIDCSQNGNVATLAQALANAVGIALKGNSNPVNILTQIKAELPRQDYRLVIADNAQYLDEACREHLIRLIDLVVLEVEVRPALMVFEAPKVAGKDFSHIAASFGYRPLGHTLSKLTRDEVTNFVTEMFPDVEGLADHLKTDEGKEMLRAFRDYSKGIPLQVANLLKAMQMNENFPAIPTAEDVHQAISSLWGNQTAKEKRSTTTASRLR